MAEGSFDLLDTFLKFEKREKLFEIHYNGIKFWHLIRFSVYSDILEYNFNLGVAHTILSKKIRIIRRIKQLPSGYLKTLHFSREMLIFYF